MTVLGWKHWKTETALCARAIIFFSILTLVPSFFIKFEKNFLLKWSAKRTLQSLIDENFPEIYLIFGVNYHGNAQLYVWNFGTFGISLAHDHSLNW